MTRRLLDLFCGAGGATKGYQQAGFYVVGIDKEPQPHYCGHTLSQWAWERPATTIQGTPRVAPPGHHDRQWNGAVKVQLHELGVLQGFPVDYPWQGNKTEQSRQIGNAIPPQLARACLAEVTGLTHTEGQAA